MKRFWTAIVFVGMVVNLSFSQDISLLHMQGQLPATYLNPGLKLDKKWNLSLAGYQIGFGTDGPSLNSLTSKNAKGERYIDINKIPNNLSDYQNVFFTNSIHTIDLSCKLGSMVLMGGHAFRADGNVRYSSDLLQLLAQGNAPFIGKTLEIAPFLDINAYNELYLGVQKTVGNLTIGAKGKLLYGTASVSTDEGSIGFTTDEEYYQWGFQTDYTLRSSALVRYTALDSITLQYSGFSFDNLFYNNQGLAFDIGASLQVGQKLTLSASAVDIGKINWDFFPRKYTTKGEYSFNGIDIVDYLVDSTAISIQDTLSDILKVTRGVENYSTRLTGTYSLGGTYALNDKWTLNGLVMVQRRYGQTMNTTSISAVRKISIMDLGLMYTFSQNNFTNLGLYGKVHLGPATAFLSVSNVPAIFDILGSKGVNARLGATIRI